MGREIRMVVPNWEHPKQEKYNYRFQRNEMVYIPMHDESFEEKIEQWYSEYTLWKNGQHPRQLNGEAKSDETYMDWAGDPPQSDRYRPNWKPEEMTWFQVYETVSEGTPVTPPFETREELVEYLVKNGDFWDQQRRKDGDSMMECGPWQRKSAENFVYGSGWAPSMVILNGEAMSGVDGLARLQ